MATRFSAVQTLPAKLPLVPGVLPPFPLPADPTSQALLEQASEELNIPDRDRVLAESLAGRLHSARARA